MNPEIIKYEKKISKFYRKLAKIREKCVHKNHNSKYGSNTGNYDPTADSYWLDVVCLDCGKQIRFDSEEAGYREFSPNRMIMSPRASS